MAKKTLAESIRATMDLINEAPAGMADALQDLHNESGGKPTAELAAEIGADYNLSGEKLLAAYPQWAQTQANKSASAPAADPEKAAMAKRYQDKQDANTRRSELEAERERRKQEQEDQQRKHKEDHADLYAAANAELEKFKSLPGWTVEEAPADSYGSFSGADTFAIDNGDGIKIILWTSVTSAGRDPEKWPAKWEIHGDVKFTADGKPFTFTRRGIDIDSFSISPSDGKDPAAVVAEQVKRVEASRARIGGEVEVPGTHGIRVSKGDVQNIADEIRSGGTYTLSPAGMGVGWELSAKPRQWAREAPEEMKKFFGLDKLYMFQLDFD
jgi:hypothetical protein